MGRALGLESLLDRDCAKAAGVECPMPISYNEPITFGREGTAKSLVCVGIDFTEEGFQSWTSAPVAELDIQLPPARHDVQLELNLAPFIVPDVVSTQQLFAFIGGLFVGYCNVSRPDVASFSVVRNIMSGRVIRMSLVLPNAVSPSSLGMSEDMRELGIYLSSIVFKTV
jgi:hypothetical protein